MLLIAMFVLGLATFMAMLAFISFCDRVQRYSMTVLCLIASVAAGVYLVYAMLRPERF